MYVGGQSCTLDILDTGGSGELSSKMHQEWIARSDVFMVVYDQSSRSSFDMAKLWIERIEDFRTKRCVTSPTDQATESYDCRSTVGTLVANKRDLIGTVPSDEGRALANMMGWSFLEISAKKDVHANIIFIRSAREYLCPVASSPDAAADGAMQWAKSFLWPSLMFRALGGAITRWILSCIRPEKVEADEMV